MDYLLSLKKMILEGFDVNCQLPGGFTPIYLCCYHNSIKCLEYLIGRGADVNSRNIEGRSSPVYICAKLGRETCLDLLLQAGASPDIPIGFELETPLWIASSFGHLNICKKLVERGSDINSTVNIYNNTPLAVSSYYGHYSIAKYLLEKGSDPNLRGAFGITPLDFACSNGKWDCMELLLKSGSLVSHQDTSSKEESPFKILIDRNDLTGLKILFKFGGVRDIHTELKYSTIFKCSYEVSNFLFNWSPVYQDFWSTSNHRFQKRELRRAVETAFPILYLRKELPKELILKILENLKGVDFL